MKKIAFQLEFTGSKKTIGELAKVQLELDSIAKAIRTAKKEGNQELYTKLLSQQLKLKESAKDLKKEIREQVKEFKSAKFPTDSLEGLRAQYAKNVKAIKSLSAEERKLAKNQQLIKRTKDLSDEINEVSKSFGSFKNNIGRYEESVTSAIGATEGLLSGSFSTFAAGLGIGGALGAGIDLLSQGVDAIAELSQEFFKLQGTVQQLTGATGDDLDRFSVNISSLANTFGEDTNEILLAANALTNQLTGDFDKSLEIIEAGLLGGANANGDFLDTLKEYPSRFKEAGFTGEQFLQVINSGVKDGVFADKLADSVSEATIAIRELTPATEKAINDIGISTKKLKDVIAKDGIGAAIQLISRQVDEFEDNGVEVGQVLADVFKGAGEDGGLQAIKSLSNIKNSLEGVVDESNKYVQSKQKLKAANDGFNESLADLNKELGVAQQELAPVGVQIKTFFIEFAIFAIQQFKELGATFSPLLDQFKRLAFNLGLTSGEGEILKTVFEGLGKVVDVTSTPIRVFAKGFTFLYEQINNAVEIGREALEFVGLIETAEQKARRKGAEGLAQHNEILKKQAVEKQEEILKRALGNLKNFYKDVNKEGDKVVGTTITTLKKGLEDLEKELQTTEIGSQKFKSLTTEIAKTKTELDKATGASKKIVSELTKDKIAKTSLAFLRKEISKYRDELEQAPDTEAARKAIEKIVKLEDEIEASQKAYEKLQRTLEGKIQREGFEVLQPLESGLPDEVGIADVDTAALNRQIEAVEILKSRKLKAAAEVAKTEEEFAKAREKIELEIETKLIELKLKRSDLTAAEREALKATLAELKANLKKQGEDFDGFRKLEEEDWEEFYKKIAKLALDTTNQLIDVQSENEKRRLRESTERRIEDIEERYGRQIELAEGNTERQQELRQQLALETERIQREQAEKEKQITIKQTIIKGALAAIAAIAQTGNLLNGLFVAAQTTAAIAVIKAQQFAGGGIAGNNPWMNVMMNPLPSGRITARQNIPTQSNGDNVLATVKRGELIMNREQQMRALLQYGDDFFKNVGIPGYAGGGLVGATPQLVNPNNYISNTTNNTTLSDNQLNLLAENIGKQVGSQLSNIGKAVGGDIGSEVKKGVVEGFTDLGRRKKLKKDSQI